jgi:hypothetical protein
MKTAYISVSIFAIVLVLMLGVPFMTGGGSNAYARYVRNTQTQANTNNCSNGTNCAITSPQTQGDGSASSPTNVQISKFNEIALIDAPTLDPTLYCRLCFTNNLPREQIHALLNILHVEDLEELCRPHEGAIISLQAVIDALHKVTSDEVAISKVIGCLKNTPHFLN